MRTAEKVIHLYVTRTIDQIVHGMPILLYGHYHCILDFITLSSFRFNHLFYVIRAGMRLWTAALYHSPRAAVAIHISGLHPGPRGSTINLNAYPKKQIMKIFLTRTQNTGQHWSRMFTLEAFL